MSTETVYIDHANVVIRYLQDGRNPVEDLSSVTKMELRDIGCQFNIDSATSPGAFDWSEGGGKLTLHLGHEGIFPGSYTMHLIVYDPSNPEGIVWDRIRLKFVALCQVGGEG